MSNKPSKNKKMPSFSAEQAVMRGCKVSGIIAFDEVGRGCFAGPVMAAASLWINNSDNEFSHIIDATNIQRLWIPQISDSKKLTPGKRQVLFENSAFSFPYIKQVSYDNIMAKPMPATFAELCNSKQAAIAFDTKGELLGDTGKAGELLEVPKFLCAGIAIGAADVQEIDSINIWNAVQLAMARALILLEQQIPLQLSSHFTNSVFVIDGNHSIKVPEKFSSKTQITAVEGDGCFVSIGFSSVIAKVVRDSYMLSLAEVYPNYGLQNHKGYGTAEHRAAIKTHGVLGIHRKTFIH